MENKKESRVLSIQSHVVSGYVGNKSAVFPLQLLGIDVDIINTVQFSNHTGYPKGWGGEVLSDESLSKLKDGLRKNALLSQITHILQGYCPNAKLLNEIIQLVIEMKAQDPNFIYVCDPVMGDNGVLYVSKELVKMYQDSVLPIAQFITPNQFEAELLSEMKIQNENDAIEAADCLHRKGVEVVVITSLFYENNDQITLLGSKCISRNSDSSLVTQKFKITFPFLHSYFTGTGDLFASLLLGWYIKSNGNLVTACEYAVASIQSVLSNTVQHNIAVSNNSDCSTNQTVTELRIIQSKKNIEKPWKNLTSRAILLNNNNDNNN